MIDDGFDHKKKLSRKSSMTNIIRAHAKCESIGMRLEKGLEFG